MRTLLLLTAVTALVPPHAPLRSPTLKMAAGGLDGTKIFEALECISQHSGLCVVVKYGGHAMSDERAAECFAQDIVLMQKLGVRPVVGHGHPEARSGLPGSPVV